VIAVIARDREENPTQLPFPDQLITRFFQVLRFSPMGSPCIEADKSYFLTTARLGFRCWKADDLELALELWGDTRVSKFIGGPFSAEQISKRLHEEMALMATQKVQYWPVFLLEDGQHAGCAGLRPYKPEARIYEIGVHLRPPFWHKGLAEEATRAIASYAFDVLDIEGLFAGHHPGNTTSRHLLEKNGFSLVGEQFYAPTGVVEPTYLLMRRR